jgi:hypothetical protein
VLGQFLCSNKWPSPEQKRKTEGGGRSKSLLCANAQLKGAQTKRSATRVRNDPQKKHEAKGDAPGLKSSDVSLVSGSERAQLGTIQNNLGNFPLLNPDFFFGVSEPAQKAVPVPFFWGGVYDLFFFNLFFDLRGVFSELQIPKSEGHLLKPGKLGPL